MRIGLIDVDGHNFQNLALMRISAYHKSKGDTASPVVYELVDEIPDCTVQILRNPATGEVSVGWYRGKMK